MFVRMPFKTNRSPSESEMGGLWLLGFLDQSRCCRWWVCSILAQNLPQISAKMASPPAKSQPEKLLQHSIIFIWMPSDILYRSPLEMSWLWLGYLVHLRCYGYGWWWVCSVLAQKICLSQGTDIRKGSGTTLVGVQGCEPWLFDIF